MIKKVIPDVLLIAGFIAISFGAWLAWSPAGFIIAGVMLILAGIKTASNA